MKKHVLTFGLISGAISSGMMFATLPFVKSGNFDFDRGEIIGYTSILLSFLLVFFGIRSYRENVGGGTVTFARAFKVGILITLVSCLMYVISWQTIYYKFAPDFVDHYTAHAIEKMREKGASETAIAAEQKKMADFKVMYDNPLINAAITLIEPLPIGLIMTLVSAAILRKKQAGYGLPRQATAPSASS